MPTTGNTNNRRRRLKVGTRVRLTYGAREVEADVIEDRGNFGVGRRQIVRIRLFGDWGASYPGGQEKSFEMPAEELTPTS